MQHTNEMSKQGHRFTNDRLTSAAHNDHPAAFNDSTDLSCPQRPSSCIQRPDRSQLTSIRHLALSPRLNLRQLPSSNVQLRTTTAWPYQPSWPKTTYKLSRTFTYTFVIPANKIVTLLYLLPSLSLAVTILTRITLKFICGVDALIGSATNSLCYCYTSYEMTDQFLTVIRPKRNSFCLEQFKIFLSPSPIKRRNFCAMGIGDVLYHSWNLFSFIVVEVFPKN